MENAVSLRTQYGSASGKQNAPHGDVLGAPCMEAGRNEREAVGRAREECMLIP